MKKTISIIFTIIFLILPYAFVSFYGEIILHGINHISEHTFVSKIFFLFLTSVIFIPLLWLPFSRIYIFIYSICIFILLGVELYCLSLLNNYSNPLMIWAILETNSDEVHSFINTYVNIQNILKFLITISILLLLLYITSRFLKRTLKYRSFKVAYTIFIILTLFPLFNWHNRSKVTNKNTLAIIINSLYLKTEQNAISNRAVSSIQEKVIDTANTLQKHKRRVYVFVENESITNNHLPSSGYSRNTYPLLSSNKNIINFTDAVAAYPATEPTTMTIFHYGTYEDGRDLPLLNFIRKAGYKTYYITNQATGIDGIIAKGGDEVYNTAYAKVNGKPPKDKVLYPYIKKVLAYNEDKQFLSIHLVGCHFQTTDRYNETVFTDTLAKNRTKDQNQMINNYDNCLLYNDQVISDIINTLKSQQNTSSFLLTLSDHGDEIFQNSTDYYGHAIYKYKTVFDIPMMLWTNDSYEESHPTIMQNTIANKDKKIMSDITPYMILHLMDISINDDTKWHKYSPASDQYDQSRKRIVGAVLDHQHIDYDSVLKSQKRAYK